MVKPDRNVEDLQEFTAQLVTKAIIPERGEAGANAFRTAMSNSVLKLAHQMDLARDAGTLTPEMIEMFREMNAMRRGSRVGIMRNLGR